MENGSSGKLFISHSSEDDTLVGKLRQQLAAHGVDGWIDSRQLRGGDVLSMEITAAIASATAFLVVVSPSAFQSKMDRQILMQQAGHQTVPGFF